MTQYEPNLSLCRQLRGLIDALESDEARCLSHKETMLTDDRNGLKTITLLIEWPQTEEQGTVEHWVVPPHRSPGFESGWPIVTAALERSLKAEEERNG